MNTTHFINALRDAYPLQVPILLSDKITRIEVIGLDGKVFSSRLDPSFYYKLSLQDDGRTLKIFKTIKDN